MSKRQHYSWPKIRQLTHAVKYARKYLPDLGTIQYQGSVKIHGTNAAVVMPEEGDLYVQSRNRTLSLAGDSAGHFGFVGFVAERADQFRAVLPTQAVVYGEWCGGGIQKGVAVAQLPKHFAVFGYMHKGERLPPPPELADIPGVHLIPSTYGPLAVSTKNPSAVAPVLERLVEAVDKECPWAAAQGALGFGEGIVWVPTDPTLAQDASLWFKTKGASHTKTKTKVFRAPTAEQIAAYDALLLWTHEVVTPRRLEQGLEYLQEMDCPLSQASTGTIIKWVLADIAAECDPPVDQKAANKAVGRQVKEWFFAHLAEQTTEEGS